MYYISWRFYKAKLMKKCWKQQKYRHRHKHTNKRLRSLHIAFFRSNSSQKSIYIISVRCSLSQRWSYSLYYVFQAFIHMYLFIVFWFRLFLTLDSTTDVVILSLLSFYYNTPHYVSIKDNRIFPYSKRVRLRKIGDSCCWFST